MYRYTDCGLRNVWLANGYRRQRSPYGMTTAIQDIPGLHRAIGLWIVKSRKRLTGAELRFLRKELDMSQAALARMLGCEEQTVSLWERQGRMPKMADRFVRAIYCEHVENNAHIREMVERLNAKDATNRAQVKFSRRADEWKAAA